MSTWKLPLTDLVRIAQGCPRRPMGHFSQEVNSQKTDMDLRAQVEEIMRMPAHSGTQPKVKLFLGLKKFHNYPQDVFHFHALFACFTAS